MRVPFELPVLLGAPHVFETKFAPALCSLIALITVVDHDHPSSLRKRKYPCLLTACSLIRKEIYGASFFQAFLQPQN
jgi:hypothetical protein